MGFVGSFDCDAAKPAARAGLVWRLRARPKQDA